MRIQRLVQTLPDAMRDDNKVMRSAVSKCGLCLQFGGPATRNSRSIALAAMESVANDGDKLIQLIQSLSDAFRDDVDLMQVALSYNRSLLRYAGPAVRNHPNITLQAAHPYMLAGCRSGKSATVSHESPTTWPRGLLGVK